MPKKRPGKGPDPVQAEAAAGWQAACELFHHIATGRELIAKPSMMVLQPGETVWGEVVLEFARFYSMNVQANQTSGFYFGSPAFVAGGLIGQSVANSNARARAAQMSQAQWRFNLPLPVAVTNQRTLTLFEGKWIEFAHDAVLAFYAEPQSYNFVLTFGVTSPLRLSGPWAPWASLMVAVGVYGLQRVPTLPAFEIFRQQTARALAVEPGPTAVGEIEAAPPRAAPETRDTPETRVDPDDTRLGPGHS